jgi:uncharacterized protein YjbI with pentapeptide repeats
MNPTVVAAWIAAGISVLTLAGTLAAQYYGYHAASRDAEKTAEEQRKQLNRTLGEQRTRTFNERFATAADHLGDDKPPTVRLAGVYAMAGLADDWPESRQTCVDVLCAYLRMPYEPDPGENAPGPQRLAFQAAREVRHTVIRVITAHLQEKAAVSWQGLDFDFRGVVFDGGDFTRAEFSGGTVTFGGTRFTGDLVNFGGAGFTGGKISFEGAEFSVGTVNFNGARFTDGLINFSQAEFSGGTVLFAFTRFSGGAKLHFNGAQFTDGQVTFSHAEFSTEPMTFGGTGICGGRIDSFGNPVVFSGAGFVGGNVDFSDARFTSGSVIFWNARFSGGTVDFRDTEFSGGGVDFTKAKDWSVPPIFSWNGTPPAGVTLPEEGRPVVQSVAAAVHSRTQS